MIIAVDFDGTIFKSKYPKVGDPIKNAVEIINRLYKTHFIIIWSCRSKNRSDYPQMIKALKKHKINYDTINKNIKGYYYQPTPKIAADIFIDDRGILGIPSWKRIERIINKLDRKLGKNQLKK